MRLTAICLPALAMLLSATMLCYGAVIPGSYLKTYVSSVDNSVQPYGLYIPTPFNEIVPHPVVFNGHGFGGHASGSFSSTQTTFANTNGCLIVQLEGRGNTFYDGVGEVDMLDVLKELRANYLIDNGRIYFEGASMGATGAYRQGVRHPDLLAASGATDGWCDYRLWVREWYAPTRDPYYVEPFRVPNLLMASCVDAAENAAWESMYLIVDTGDTNVWPQNTYNFDARLTALGQQTPETDYVHTEMQYTGGHTANYRLGDILNYFINNTTHAAKTLVTSPTHVVCKTTRLKYGSLHWVTIDRLLKVNDVALVDARVNGSQVTVTAQNTRQITLRLGSAPVTAGQQVTVTINSTTAYTGAVGTITLYASVTQAGAINGWSTTDPAPGERHKTAALEGPIGDAYTSKFLVVYGTSGTADETTTNLNEANSFCQRWNSWMGATISPKADSSVTAADISSSNLMLIGTADSNSILQNINSGLPISVTRSGITYRGQTYTGSQYGAYFAYPNPSSPTHYVVISHLVVPGTGAKDLEALPWYWPDYVIFDTTRQAGACVQASLAYLPDTFVEAGYFNEDWSDNYPPAAVNDAYQTNENTVLNVPVTGVLSNDTDRDGDALTAILVTGPQNGVLTLHADGSFTYSPTAGFHGADTFTYQASDSLDHSNVATVTVQVNAVNTPPVAMNDAYSADQSTVVTVNAPGVLANDQDADGDTLSATLVQNAAYGTATLNPDGSFTYTPNTSGVTQDSFTYHTSDGTAWSNEATVTLHFNIPKYEADVSPRSSGNGVVGTADWQQVGRFAAGLDTAAAGDEYQRADCAPRASLGDGRLSVTDWVQAARYAAGMDPLTLAGGPAGSSLLATFPGTRFFKLPVKISALTLANVSARKGKTATVTVALKALGNESAFGFGVNFDPRLVTFVSASLTGSGTGSTLLVNSNQAASGFIGIMLMRPLPSTFTAGQQNLLSLTFQTTKTLTSMTPITFADQSIVRETSDNTAHTLATSYYNGSIRIW